MKQSCRGLPLRLCCLSHSLLEPSASTDGTNQANGRAQVLSGHSLQVRSGIGCWTTGSQPPGLEVPVHSGFRGVRRLRVTPCEVQQRPHRTKVKDAGWALGSA